MVRVSSSVLKIVLALNAFVCMADFFIMAPVLDTLYELFPDADMTLMGLLLTISAPAVLLSSLLTHPLEKRISLKAILVGGNIIFFLSGWLCSFADSVEMMAALRVLEGFGCGFVVTSNASLIAVLFYDDEHTRNKVMGWNGSCNALFGFALSMGSGMLAVYGWQYPFYLYLVGIVITVLDILVIPSFKYDENLDGNTANEFLDEQGNVPRSRITKGVVSICLQGFAFAVMTGAFFTYVSSYVVETGTGDSVLAGTILSMETIAALPVGLVLARLMRRFKFAFPLVAWILMLAGRFIMQYLSVGAWAGIAAGLVFGLGYGMFYPYMYAKAAREAAPYSETLTEACVASSYYLGSFVSVFVVSWYMRLIGEFSSIAAMHFVLIACMFMVLVNIVRCVIKARKYKGRA